MALSFAFDANTETPESAARRRALAEAIMGRTMSPQNVGEGFGAIASGIVANVNNSRAQEAETVGRAGANDVFSQLVSGITGGSPAYTPSGGSPALGAANAVGQSAPTTSSLNGSQQEFIDALMPTAMEVGAELGIDPRIIVAQAAQETGWGRSAPGNNFFGIKSHGQGGGQTLNTHEYVNGQRVNVSDSFRTFNSPEDSVRGYGDFIRSNPRYGDFMSAQGLDAQLDALQASGYATDPNYSASVGSIARGIALPQQTQQVAGLDNTGISIPGVTDAPVTAAPQPSPGPVSQSGLPQSAAPGTVAQGADGRTYMYAETSGMAGATGNQGWIPYGGGQQNMGQPQQVAQGPSLEELLMVSQNPWLNDGQRSALNTMIETELQRQDPRYQQQLQMGDLQLEQLRRQLNAPNLMEVGGQLYNPDTGEWIAPPTGPAAPQYEVIDGEVVWLDPAQQTATSGGQFGTPDPQGFSTVTLQLPDGTQRSYNTADPAQAQAANQLLGQGAVEVSGSGVTVNNNLGDSLSPGWEAIDKAFADTYLSWTGGGSADINAQLANLDNALTLMEGGQAETGNAMSAMPRDVQAFFNSDGLIARENVEETVQRSLRETLGAQFTEREGERLIQRAFNPLLPTEENIRRVNLLVGKIKEMSQAKDAMADYFRQNGTLMGYEGLTPTMSDLSSVEQQFGEDPQGGAGAASNQSQPNPDVVDFSDYF